MARNADEVRQSLANSIAQTSPNTDLAKGPAFNILLAPSAPEISSLEAQVEDVRTLASLQMDRVVTLDEVNRIGNNFGIVPLLGLKSKMKQLFWSVTRPNSDVVIPRGTVVSTTDSQYSFVTTEEATMFASTANAYRNSSRRRYEITIPVEAVAVGADYNLPAFRVNKLLTPISGIDGTENREEAVGGSERQAFQSYLNRIRRKFEGMNPDSAGGVISSIYEYDPEAVTDVMLVYPKDRDIFRRDTGRPAIDAYINGTSDVSTTQQEIPTVATSFIVLENQPVSSVSSVLVDGTALESFALEKDTDPTRKNSQRAHDRVVFGTPINPNQVVNITYSYDETVNGIQLNKFDSEESMFGTDVLVRLFEEVAIIVQIDLVVLPSFDPNRVTASVESIVRAYVEPEYWTASLSPEQVVDRVTSNVNGIASLRMTRFTKKRSGALPVETLNFKKNEMPIIDTATFAISARR